MVLQPMADSPITDSSDGDMDEANVELWSNFDVIAWVAKNVHGGEIPVEIESALQQHEISGKDLLELDRDDLKDLGYTRIPQIRKMRTALERLREMSGAKARDHCDTRISNEEDCQQRDSFMHRVKSSCPTLFSLLGPELLSELEKLPEEGLPETETEYWLRVNLLFILRVFVARTRLEIATGMAQQNKDKVPEHLLERRLSFLQELLESAEKRLNYGSPSPSWTPLLERVAPVYGLRDVEKLFMQLLVTLKTQPLDGPLSSLMFPDSSRNGDNEGFALRSGLKAWVCGMSPLQLTRLAREDRALCLDRVLVLTEEDYSDETRLSVSEEVCKALMGQELDVEERLKLAGTRLLTILDDEEQPLSLGNAANKKVHRDPTNSNQESTRATVNELLQTLSLGGDVDEVLSPESENARVKNLPAVTNESSSESAEIITDADLAATEEESLVEMNSALQALSTTNPTPPPSSTPTEDREPRCYTCELDYLNDQFALVMQQVQSSSQRLAQDLKDSSFMETQPKWMRTADYGSMKVSVGELSAKLRLAQRKIELSLELTRKEGTFYPRLEGLVDQLGLDSFEKSVLLYLAGSMISPIFKSCIENCFRNSGHRSRSSVGDLLVVFCPSVSEQVAARTYFYQTGKLVRKGLIRLFNVYGGDLTDHELQLDRRVLDCIIGLENESTEVVKGGNLYDPTVDIDQVVLTPNLKESILDAVTYFDAFRMYRKRRKFDEAISYGVGLTLMFCGVSGTGKTMTANAIAAKLGKKLLLVNFPRLFENDSTRNGDSGVQSVFREAELSDAIIFFDECESIFAQRGAGGSTQITQLLSQLERFDGICFLATNRPYDLDEAMHRRISEVFLFTRPNHLERLKIWQLVTAHDSIPCEDTIDWESIALQFEITGGYIKNVVISALLAAVGRDPSSPMITQSDIVEGCKKQMRGALQMLDFDERILPSAGIEDLVVSDDVGDSLQEMVQLEKARGVLFGVWGFSDDMRGRQGTTALFWGPKGCGKSSAAEAVGFELGKALKVVDIPQLLVKRSGQQQSTTSVLEVFREARLMDAVLVLDGYSLNTDSGGHGAGDDTRLLNLLVREMARFPGVVIMMVDTTSSLDIFASRLDKGLLSGLKYLVEFSLPDLKARQVLWEKLLPTAVPKAGSIKFQELAIASEKFSQVQIANAIYRACASAALRPESKRRVKMADLKTAIEDEKHRGESAVDRWVKAQYL